MINKINEAIQAFEKGVIHEDIVTGQRFSLDPGAPKAEVLKCTECGEEMTGSEGTSSTYAGYISPPGHNHDNNCVSRLYRCKNGHTRRIFRQNTGVL